MDASKWLVILKANVTRKSTSSVHVWCFCKNWAQRPVCSLAPFSLSDSELIHKSSSHPFLLRSWSETTAPPEHTHFSNTLYTTHTPSSVSAYCNMQLSYQRCRSLEASTPAETHTHIHTHTRYLPAVLKIEHDVSYSQHMEARVVHIPTHPWARCTHTDALPETNRPGEGEMLAPLPPLPLLLLLSLLLLIFILSSPLPSPPLFSFAAIYTDLNGLELYQFPENVLIQPEFCSVPRPPGPQRAVSVALQWTYSAVCKVGL